MMKKIKEFSVERFGHFSKAQAQLATWAIALGSMLIFLGVASPALAHHAFGGGTPKNVFEGFLSGLAHPVIGLDHFAFVVAIGLIAASIAGGILMPISFAIATIIGTGIHLAEIDIPLLEIIIAFSVLAFGVMVARQQKLNALTLAAIAAVAGIFHGYAYGEAIVGAEMTPLVAYLAGFALIQMAIALSSMYLAKFASRKFEEQSSFSMLQGLGWAIGGIGVAFLSSAILG